MKKLILALGLLIVSASATSAFAKDLCVDAGGGIRVQFNKVVLLKGKTTLLAGRADVGGNNVPVVGTLTLDADNVTTRIGVMVYQIPGSWNIVGFTMSVVGDKLFNASGFFDNFPLNSNGDGAVTWTSVLCSSVPPAFPSRAVVGPAPGILE
jgi:hypothetical protein